MAGPSCDAPYADFIAEASKEIVESQLADSIFATVDFTEHRDREWYCQVVELRASLLSHRFLSSHFCSVILPKAERIGSGRSV